MTMGTIYDTEISCGVVQFSGLGGRDKPPADVERDLVTQLELFDNERKGLPPFVIFSNTDTRFADYLARKYRGSITKVGPVVNPSSGNKIWMVVFKLPKAFAKQLCNCVCHTGK